MNMIFKAVCSMSYFTLIFAILFWISTSIFIIPLFFFFFLYIHFYYYNIFVYKKKPIPSLELEDGVGIIIPFNGEWDLIDQAVSSLVEQSYKGPIQIVIAHHESQPTSFERLNRLSELSSPLRQIQIVKSEHPEKWIKLNLCISKIQTKFVGFLDSDHIAEKNWISEATSLLASNNQWTGVQCIRRPIKKNGLIYAWDSFINNQGNEVLNLVKSRLGYSVPFTGTTALFFFEKIKSLPFQESITEDTNWYLEQKFKSIDFFIGYLETHGSFELMSLSWNELVKRRLRWAQGHNKAFFQHAKFTSPITIAKMIDWIHGLHYLMAIPLTLSLGIYFAYFFFQMGIVARFTSLILATLGSFILGKNPGFKESRFSFRFLFLMILFSMILTWAFHFNNIWLSQLIETHQLIALIGTNHYSLLLYASLFIFIFSYFISNIRLIPWRYFISSIIFFPFLALTELMASFLAFAPKSFNKDKSWNTGRKSNFVFDFLIIILIMIMITLQSYQVLDHRSFQKFLADSVSYFTRPKFPKKLLTFSKIRGIALNGKPSEKLLNELAFSGARELRFYNDPGSDWIQRASESGFKVVIQPDFASWDGIDVRNESSRKFLSMNIATLDAKYRENNNVLFLALGNEIDLAFFIRDPIESHDEKFKYFFTFFNKIFEDLDFTAHVLTVASPYVDRSNNTNLLMINTLNLDLRFWTNDLANPPQNKILVAGEWGGFKASKELPSDWLRGYRVENQWGNITSNGNRGGFFFAAQDNPWQLAIDHFKDPFSVEPDDLRGMLDINGLRKEIFWTIAYLYSPLKFIKVGENVALVNNGNEKLEHILLSHLSNDPIDLSPGERHFFSKSKFNPSLEYEASFNLPGEKLIRKNIVFHAQGRLTGCLKPIYKNPHNLTFDLKNLKSSDILIAEFKDYKKIKMTGADVYSPGKIGLVEIHPNLSTVSFSGISNVSYLQACRQSFLLE